MGRQLWKAHQAQNPRVDAQFGPVPESFERDAGGTLRRDREILNVEESSYARAVSHGFDGDTGRVSIGSARHDWL